MSTEQFRHTKLDIIIRELFNFTRNGSLPEVSEYIKNLETYCNQYDDDLRDYINFQNKKGETLLHLAAFNKDAECTKFLLSYGAKQDIADKQGDYPIHRAAFLNSQILKTLLENAPFMVNSQNASGITPLFYALEAEKKQNIKLLIENGASITKESYTGSSPLSFALAYPRKANMLFDIQESIERSKESLFDKEEVNPSVNDENDQPNILHTVASIDTSFDIADEGFESRPSSAKADGALKESQPFWDLMDQ